MNMPIRRQRIWPAPLARIAKKCGLPLAEKRGTLTQRPVEMETEYKIIGGDGAEYGPASLDELKSWIGDGRVAGFTQVWRSDLALWTPAARFAELQQALARSDKRGLHDLLAGTRVVLQQ